MDDIQFAWVISAFHLGGFLAIFISPYMMHFKFNTFLITMLTILAISNVLMVIWYSFAGLIILRIISGIVCTITWSEVTGAVGAFTQAGSERTTGIIVTESSFTITTFFYVVIGVILKNLNVTWFWIIMAAMGIVGALFACLLPHISLFNATQGNVRKMKRIKSTSTLALVPATPHKRHLQGLEGVEEFDEFPDAISDIDEEKEQDDIEKNDNAFKFDSKAKVPSVPRLPSARSDTVTSTTSITASPQKKDDGKFSLSACFKAYGNVRHLMVHFFLLFCMSTQFSAFSVSFGKWLVDTYNLDAAELGYFTLANTLGGMTALFIAPIISIYRPNIFGIIIGTMGVAVMTFIISVLVWTGENRYILILIFFYLYWVASQVMFLNIIVCNLDFSPKGYESTSSLIFQMIARCASFIGTLLGPNIVKWVSFPFLINVSCVLFVVASVLYTGMYRYLSHKTEYQKLMQVGKSHLKK